MAEEEVIGAVGRYRLYQDRRAERGRQDSARDANLEEELHHVQGTASGGPRPDTG
jgi:hypothetical protein